VRTDLARLDVVSPAPTPHCTPHTTTTDHNNLRGGRGNREEGALNCPVPGTLTVRLYAEALETGLGEAFAAEAEVESWTERKRKRTPPRATPLDALEEGN
jgi:hypothetical protein